MSEEQTIARELSWEGVGLHTAEPARIRLRPAAPGHGIVFRCVEGATAIRIPARVEFVVSTRNATTLAAGGAAVATVEHLLAAFLGFGIDDVEVEVEGPEVPALDGSAKPFAEGLRKAGVRSSGRPCRHLAVTREVEIALGERRIRVEPADHFAVSYAVDYAHPSIGRQEIHFEKIDAEVFEGELAAARTFGFLADVEALRAAGLGLGGGLENTVVLDGQGVMNPDGLRFPDEFVRHKVIDLLGDLSLLGGRLRGRVSVERGGHSLHRALVDALLEDPGACEWTLQDAQEGASTASRG